MELLFPEQHSIGLYGTRLGYLNQNHYIAEHELSYYGYYFFRWNLGEDFWGLRLSGRARTRGRTYVEHALLYKQ
jgi:hypothetical protein